MIKPSPDVSIGFALVTVSVALAGGPALADEKDDMIKSALSAAPPAIAATAKVMNMKGEMLREGAGPYTCMPYEGPGFAPMCLDAEWMRWLHAYAGKQPFKAEKFGLAYMLAGDPRDSGASNVDPFATAATADNQWVIEGPHIMILVPDERMLAAVTKDPNAGVPYVMWAGTPYAHIMMPVGPRPK
jgi:hypothetical protein